MGFKMIKLSFIVPIYNVAPYLRKCVDSLIHQDYEDYEIILVDDGSTDNSPQICDEYVRDSVKCKVYGVEIKCIHQENRGLSAARNEGLKAAKGEYVCFVDSDDYWEENVLSRLMAQIKREKLDVLRFDYQNVRMKNEGVKELESEGEYEVFEPNKESRYIDKCNEVVDGETYLNTRMGYACYAVMYIVRRAMLYNDCTLDIGDCTFHNGDCLFTEGIHFEDVDWLPRMMLRAKRVNSTTTVVYNYLVRQGSITKTQGEKAKIRKNIEDRLLILDKYRLYREQYPKCEWLYNMQSSMTVGALTTIAREFFEERKAYIDRLQKMKALPLRIANQGKTYKRRAVLVNTLGFRVYCALIRFKELVS